MRKIAIIHIELKKHVGKNLSAIVAADFDPNIDDKNEICNIVNNLFNNAGYLPQDNETQSR